MACFVVRVHCCIATAVFSAYSVTLFLGGLRSVSCCAYFSTAGHFQFEAKSGLACSVGSKI